MWIITQCAGVQRQKYKYNIANLNVSKPAKPAQSCLNFDNDTIYGGNLQRFLSDVGFCFVFFMLCKYVFNNIISETKDEQDTTSETPETVDGGQSKTLRQAESN